MVGAIAEPPATGVTVPTPLSMMRLVAFAVVQVRVGAPLVTNVFGVAVSVQVGAEGGGGVVVTVIEVVQVTLPPAPVAVPV